MILSQIIIITDAQVTCCKTSITMPFINILILRLKEEEIRSQKCTINQLIDRE